MHPPVLQSQSLLLQDTGYGDWKRFVELSILAIEAKESAKIASNWPLGDLYVIILSDVLI